MNITIMMRRNAGNMLPLYYKIIQTICMLGIISPSLSNWIKYLFEEGWGSDTVDCDNSSGSNKGDVKRALNLVCIIFGLSTIVILWVLG